MSRPANPVTLPLADYSPQHFLLAVVDGVATVTLNRPERKNPLTFESYRELTDFFRACAFDDAVKTIVVSGAGGNFSSAGRFQVPSKQITIRFIRSPPSVTLA